MPTVADEITAFFTQHGESAYFGEPVSQLEHALQAAHFARQAKATPALIAAALLHDIGHLVADTPENIADLGIDARHEEIGEQWLASRFPENVVEPVRLHVSAKRYLCATDPSYFARLSPASVQSLALQGGPMTPPEVRAFEANEFYREALALRSWDDKAKIQNLVVAPLTEYRELLDSVAI